MNRHIPAATAAIKEYVPITDIKPIRLDANESPYPLPENIRAEINAALSGVELNRYPDPTAGMLVREYSRLYGIDPVCCVAGNGSDELIQLIMSALTKPGDRVALATPDFSMYEFYARINGCETPELKKADGVRMDLDEYEAFVESNNCTLAIFSNPCNPTGGVCTAGDIIRFVDRTKALVVVDEAYAEFNGNRESLIKYAADRDNLIVLRTLSKAFSFAAARIGFAVSCKELISAIRKLKSPYNLNSFSQSAGVCLLSHGEEYFSAGALLGESARSLRNSIAELLPEYGYAYETSTNFVYVSLPGRAKAVTEALSDEGISIRRFAEDNLRITCGTDGENRALLTALAKAIKNI